MLLLLLLLPSACSTLIRVDRGTLGSRRSIIAGHDLCTCENDPMRCSEPGKGSSTFSRLSPSECTQFAG